MRYQKFILGLSFLFPLLLAGCGARKSEPILLRDARVGFKSKLDKAEGEKTPLARAPANVFRTIKYPAPDGEYGAYLTPDPGDGKQHPAIIWITGGECNSIGDVWSPRPVSNDQSAAAYRQAGIVMMFPSLRGGNDNPGQMEGFLGETDDVLAATDFLAKQPYVDPQRIYLGGHSSGGTLALLLAEYSDRYRAVFCFGPVDDVANYGKDSGLLPFNIDDQKEVELRSPWYWLETVQSPTWVLEGTSNPGNIESLRLMSARPDLNPNIHFLEVKGADHFNILAPTNELIANKITADKGATCNILLDGSEVNVNFGR